MYYSEIMADRCVDPKTALLSLYSRIGFLERGTCQLIWLKRLLKKNIYISRAYQMKLYSDDNAYAN